MLTGAHGRQVHGALSNRGNRPLTAKAAILLRPASGFLLDNVRPVDVIFLRHPGNLIKLQIADIVPQGVSMRNSSKGDYVSAPGVVCPPCHHPAPGQNVADRWSIRNIPRGCAASDPRRCRNQMALIKGVVFARQLHGAVAVAAQHVSTTGARQSLGNWRYVRIQRFSLIFILPGARSKMIPGA